MYYNRNSGRPEPRGNFGLGAGWINTAFNRSAVTTGKAAFLTTPANSLAKNILNRVQTFMTPPSIPVAAGAQPMVAVATPSAPIVPPPTAANPVGYQIQTQAAGPSSMPVSTAPAQASTDAPAAAEPPATGGLPMLPIVIGVGVLLALMSSHKH